MQIKLLRSSFTGAGMKPEASLKYQYSNNSVTTSLFRGDHLHFLTI